MTVGTSPGRKPIDLGNGHVAASFDSKTAAWISIGGPHPTEGFVELSAVPPFDEASRGDPVATRRYRASLAVGAHAFLTILIDDAPPSLEPDHSSPTAPSWIGDGLRITCVATQGGLRQRWSSDEAWSKVSLRLRGRLDRPALAEITELDPPVPTGALTTFAIDDGRAVVRAERLDAIAVVQIVGGAIAWEADGDGLIGRPTWTTGDSNESRPLEIVVALHVGPGQGRPQPPTMASADPIAERALAYTRGCTALSTGPDERTILADHRILPLSWTRDAYWQALALLAIDGPGDREIVADHLRWLWRRCERPDGRWVRSHHADGRRKDRAFQADQQLYPLIELADYWRHTGRLPSGVRWESSIGQAWDAAMDEVDPSTSLIASAENAADDPVEAPFIASSQILLWYAARRAAELADGRAVDLDPATFTRVAERVRAAFDSLMTLPGKVWPYAIDGRGARVVYHDANDLPVALAPLWGFCAPIDPGWQATMAFAFSDANPGLVPGPRGGLGSAHTPGPWTLGDIQAWVRSLATGDAAGVAAARRRLAEVAFDDGMLPEACATNGDERVRTWFAWPGAAYAALATLDGAGRLATIMA